MLKNYITIALRNLLKSKLFSLINISGMAISIACFLIIAVYVYDELKFDRHVEDAGLKFRVYTDFFSEDGSIRKAAMVPPAVAPGLMNEFAEVDYYARFMNFNNPQLFEVGEKKLTEAKGGYADPDILKMFSLKLVEGDINTALKGPKDVAISKTLALRYFGESPALDQTIEIFDDQFKVTAVFEDFPVHSHLQLNYFIGMEYLRKLIPERMQRWSWNQFHTYVKLKSGTDASRFEAKLLGFAERNAWPVTKPSGFYYILHLMPIERVHLHASDHQWDIAVRGNAQTVYILAGTAVFILLIAILNFINLSTARAVNRVKEVGVRKVVGAFRSQLVYQFISESVLIAFIALLIGGLMAELALSPLNAFAEKSIPMNVFLNPLVILLLLVFAAVVGVAAGAYPAFYVSSYHPSQILSSKKSGRSGKTVLRQTLVVVQFVLSLFLIIASLVVSEQHAYMRSKDMGFNKDNLVVVQLRGTMQTNLETTKNTFTNHSNIISASLGYGLPGEAYAGDGIIDQETKKDWPISLLTVDHDYIKTLDIDLIAGRDFSKDILSDEKSAFIISEGAVKMLGHTSPEDALGHELAWQRWDAPDSLKVGKVIGVVKDFHLNSLHQSVSPVLLQVYPFAYSSLTMRIKSENVPETIAHLEKSWKQFNPEWPFEYRFVDDNFDKLYKAEERLAKLFSFFTGFTIFVACLGLFGLVVYSTTQRYREISIRKVLGADETGLVVKLSKSYLYLVAIAFVIAIPAAYYLANQWLQRFAYRIEITPILFIKAALFILVLSLLTVGIQSLKAARSNPVNALKEE